jgi:hypothetical protein
MGANVDGGEDQGESSSDMSDQGSSTPQDMTGAPNYDLTGPASIDGSSADLGGMGAACTTACDCMPGLACFNMQCIAGFAPVYCCQSAVCPNGSFCENQTGGFGMCGGGRRDLGAFDVCPFIGCNGGNGLQRCMNMGCSMCVARAGGGGMVCAK